MNLELTEEQVALRDTVRRFLAERAPISGHVRPMLDDPTGTTEAVWRGLADLGATGLLVPQECGGADMTMVEAGIVAEELGAALHPGPWLSTAVGATRALTRLGGASATEILSGIADGTTIATIGLLDAGSVAAVERDDGDGRRVTLKGEIAAVADAAAADLLLVLARDRDGTGLFAVKTASSGVSVIPERGVDQTRKQFRVELDGVTAAATGARRQLRPSRRWSTTCSSRRPPTPSAPHAPCRTWQSNTQRYESNSASSSDRSKRSSICASTCMKRSSWPAAG